MKKISTLLIGVVLSVLFTFPAMANDDSWSLVCPDDVTVDCDAELWDLSIYGNAYIQTHYGTMNAGTPTVTRHIGSCGSGTITRTWRAEDPYWNWITCTQTITVGGGGSFGYSNIRFPQDVNLFGCHPDVHPSATGYPEYDYVECSMIGISHSDMVFTVNAQCKKIMRTWKVLNWCTTGGYGNYPTFTHVQFIKIMANDVPDVTCPSDITVSSLNCKDANVVAPPLVVDASSCGGQYTIKNNSPYSTSKGADISGKYPIGKTKVGYTIEYGCGLKKSCYVNVIVKNDKPPVPICIGQLNIALMGIDTDKDGINDQGMVDIWAKDLDWKSELTCGQGPLQFSFAKDSLVMWRRFTCDDLGVNDVYMYVSDRGGATSYCKVKIDVQNNGAKITPCERKVDPPVDTTPHQSYLNIAGKVMYANKKAVIDYNMNLHHMKTTTQYINHHDTTIVTKVDSFINYSGVKLYFYTKDTVITTTTDTLVNEGEVFEALTDDTGLFVFDSTIITGEDYKLTCADMKATTTGIDKNDLDRLTAIILGNVKPETANEYLAADVNGDGKIDIDDLGLVISFIKEEISSFSDNDWVVYPYDTALDASPDKVFTMYQKNMQWDSMTSSVKDLTYYVVQRGDLIEEPSELANVALQLRDAGEHLRDKKLFTNVTPNPFVNNLNIHVTNAIGGIAKIKIFDISGTLLYQSKVEINSPSQSINIDLSHIQPSVLYYQVECNGEMTTGKAIKID